MYYGEESDLSACLNEYEKLIIRMNKPRVVIDNGVCPNSTVIKVDSARRQGVLLESIQVLSDMNLSIRKAYISSDGKWNMDVFHVTDLDGNKLADETVTSYIEKSIETTNFNRTNNNTGLTVLELTGTDRIGLLSEVFAVLSELQCSVTESKVWTHNGRIASLIYIKDRNSDAPVTNPERLNQIEIRLRNVLKWGSDFCVSMGVVHGERRLHQMMFADRDYEKKFDPESSPVVTVQNLENNGYSVVNLQCQDRNKLMFDVVCTLTDMDYVVFHAAIQTASNRAFLEFYIRHKDGTPISSEPESKRVIQCLQAAVDRRASQGVELELRTPDRNGLLAEVTRTFRENGLNVTRSEISTRNNVAAGTFYVTGANGDRGDPTIIESVRRKIGLSDLKFREFSASICNQIMEREEPQQHQTVLVLLGSLVRRKLYNLGLITSYSF